MSSRVQPFALPGDGRRPRPDYARELILGLRLDCAPAYENVLFPSAFFPVVRHDDRWRMREAGQLQQLHERDDVPFVLLAENDQRFCRPGPVGIADDEEELTVVLDHILQRRG